GCGLLVGAIGRSEQAFEGGENAGQAKPLRQRAGTRIPTEREMGRPGELEHLMRKITDAEIRFFDENGFVICRGVLQADELENFRAESARLIQEVRDGGPADKACGRGPE